MNVNSQEKRNNSKLIKFWGVEKLDSKVYFVYKRECPGFVASPECIKPLFLFTTRDIDKNEFDKEVFLLRNDDIYLLGDYFGARGLIRHSNLGSTSNRKQLDSLFATDVEVYFKFSDYPLLDSLNTKDLRYYVHKFTEEKILLFEAEFSYLNEKIIGNRIKIKSDKDSVKVGIIFNNRSKLLDFVPNKYLLYKLK